MINGLFSAGVTTVTIKAAYFLSRMPALAILLDHAWRCLVVTAKTTSPVTRKIWDDRTASVAKTPPSQKRTCNDCYQKSQEKISPYCMFVHMITLPHLPSCN